MYEHIPFYKKSFDEAGFDLYSVKSLDDVMKTFPEMSSWYQIEVDTDHRSLDIVTLKAEPNPDVDLDSIADIDRLQKRISDGAPSGRSRALASRRSRRPTSRQASGARRVIGLARRITGPLSL